MGEPLRPPKERAAPLRAGAIVPASNGISETLRIVDLLAEDFARTGADWGASTCERLRRESRAGILEGVLLVGPKDEAVGLAWRSPQPCELGQRVGLYLAPEYRSPTTMARFLDRLEAEGGLGPVVAVGEPWPGARREKCEGPFAERGFSWVERIGMEFPASCELPVPRAKSVAPRPITSDDEIALIRLQLATYDEDPVERALFVRFRDRWADAEHGIRALTHGELGPFLAAASFALPMEGGLAAATLVNELDGSLITEVMTHPAHRRRGYAERLLVETVGAIRALNLPTPRLVVTLSNPRALALYERFGFRRIPADRGGLFLHTGRLATPALSPRTLEGPTAPRSRVP